MKKLVLIMLVLGAFVLSTHVAVAKDMNWDSIRQAWAQVVAQQKLQDAQFKAIETPAKPAGKKSKKAGDSLYIEDASEEIGG